MSKHVPWSFKIGKHKVAGGLSWIPLVGSGSREIRSEFRQYLKAKRARYGLVSTAADARYALAGIVQRDAARVDRALASHVPAALWFAASSRDPTVYVQQVGSALWVLIRSSGRLDPRSDQVLTPPEAEHLVAEVLRGQIQDGYQPLLAVSPGIKHLPASWGSITSARELELHSLLTKMPPPARINKAIGIPTWVTTSLLALAGLCCAVYAGIQVRDRMAEALLQSRSETSFATEAANQAESEQQRESLIAAAGQAALDVRTRTPDPRAVIEQCLAATSSFPSKLGGWDRKAISCQGGRLTASYSLDAQAPGSFATESTFRAAASARKLDATLQWFGTTATVVVPVEPAPARPAIALADLVAPVAVGARFSSLSQRLSRLVDDARIEITTPAPAPLPQINGHAVDSAFQTASLTANGSGAWLLKAAIPSDPYLSVESIEMTGGTRDPLKWTVKASLVLAES